MKFPASAGASAPQVPESAPPESARTRRGVRAGRDTVRGERSSPVIARALSVQARATHYLALGLMLAIGAGLLLWYYSHQLARQDRTRQNARIGTARLADTEMALPPLGPIDAPRLAPVAAPLPPALQPSPATTGAGAHWLPLASAMRPSQPPMRVSSAGIHTVGSAAVYPAATAPPSPHSSALQRRLSGDVLFSAPAGPGGAAGPGAQSAAGAQTLPSGPAVSPAATARAADEGPHGGGLAALLQTSTVPTVSAHLLPDPSLLLPKGAFIDCTLETAIDSTLPGMTTCVTATDTFGADGRVVLLERGTKLVGETRGQVQQGAARVFVVWTEARTPGGVVVPLDSPGTDQLGRSGLPGKVQRHFWQRFGAAILVSIIDGGVQAAVQSANRGNGTVIYDPGAAQDVMTEVLKSTVAIAPTVIKRNGDRIQVLVARDLDFSSVYELRDTHRAR